MARCHHAKLGPAAIFGFTFLVAVVHVAEAQPAFPGAMGHAAQTAGGRGGQVLFVENLNAEGPGSLRHAVEQEGPRIVVFRTGGTITVDEAIRVFNPHLTIAGQTAPGDGINIKAGPHLHSPVFAVHTHDVIIRGMRFRPAGIGEPPDGDDSARDCLNILGPASSSDRPARNIIIDHCSMSWGVDENFSIWREGENITVQNSIISEALMYSLHPESNGPPWPEADIGQDKPWPHSMGVLIGNGGVTNLTMHANLIASNNRRNPQINGGGSALLSNNVVYNWGGLAMQFIRGYRKDLAHRVDVVGNYYKPGPNSASGVRGVFIQPPGDRDRHPLLGSRFYVEGNLGPFRQNHEADEWDVVHGLGGWEELGRDELMRRYRADRSVVDRGEVHIRSAEDAYEHVLANAGAVPRDATDQRIVNDVRSGTGDLIDGVQDIGGYPRYDPGTPPADADNDGMPDSWEREHGLDPESHDAGGRDLSEDGYTNIEIYINGLISP